jgi:hypothetical protein
MSGGPFLAWSLFHHLLHSKERLRVWSFSQCELIGESLARNAELPRNLCLTFVLTVYSRLELDQKIRGQFPELHSVKDVEGGFAQACRN